jgi:hypothetical protein
MSEITAAQLLFNRIIEERDIAILEEAKDIMRELEESAKIYGWKIKRNPFSDRVKANELADSAKQDFISGANWQAERMYSEEEVLEHLNKLLLMPNSELDTFTDDNEMMTSKWFEQFRKK